MCTNVRFLSFLVSMEAWQAGEEAWQAGEEAWHADGDCSVTTVDLNRKATRSNPYDNDS